MGIICGMSMTAPLAGVGCMGAAKAGAICCDAICCAAICPGTKTDAPLESRVRCFPGTFVGCCGTKSSASPESLVVAAAGEFAGELDHDSSPDELLEYLPVSD